MTEENKTSDNPRQKTFHRIVLGDSRRMSEIDNSEVQVVVTSPPYPMIKMWDDLFRQLDPEIAGLWENLDNASHFSERERIVKSIYERCHSHLDMAWRECWRVLIDGGIACINIGDATRTMNGRFRLFANHAHTVESCEHIGFTTLPYILWRKPTTRPKYKGKGAFLGSGFLPTNAYVTLDQEFILLFRKGGPRKFPPKDEKRYASVFTKRERDSWFTQTWDIVGARQENDVVGKRVASFPEEIPRRLIRMFSIIDDTVLDPFLGSGTTSKVARLLGRNSIGYEYDEALLPAIKERIGFSKTGFGEVGDADFEIVVRR